MSEHDCHRCCVAWYRVLIAGGLLLATGICAPGARAQVQAMADGGFVWGYDSNVHESAAENRRVDDNYGRMEAHVHALSNARRAGRMLVDLRIARESYWNRAEENRHLVRALCGWRFDARRSMVETSWSSTFTQREYASERDLARHEIAQRGRWNLRGRSQLTWSGRGIGLNTRAGGASERRGWELGAELEHPLHDAWRAAARLEGGGVRFERNAVDWSAARVIDLGKRQSDRTLLLGMRFQRTRAPMLSLSYGFRRLWSNSFGFSFERHEFLGRLSFLLPRRISCHLLGRWQETRYIEEGYLVVLTQEDTEDQELGERSGLTAQLSRPMGESLTIQLRASWLRNEALVRRHHYEKVRFEAALRMGGR